jgi:hypothetical protein
MLNVTTMVSFIKLIHDFLIYYGKARVSGVILDVVHKVNIK